MASIFSFEAEALWVVSVEPNNAFNVGSFQPAFALEHEEAYSEAPEGLCKQLGHGGLGRRAQITWDFFLESLRCRIQVDPEGLVNRLLHDV